MKTIILISTLILSINAFAEESFQVPTVSDSQTHKTSQELLRKPPTNPLIENDVNSFFCDICELFGTPSEVCPGVCGDPIAL